MIDEENVCKSWNRTLEHNERCLPVPLDALNLLIVQQNTSTSIKRVSEQPQDETKRRPDKIVASYSNKHTTLAVWKKPCIL